MSSTAKAQSFRARFLNPHVYRTRVDFKAVRIAQVRRKVVVDKKAFIEQGFWVTPKDTFLIQVDSTAATPPEAKKPPLQPKGTIPAKIFPQGVEGHFLDYKIVSEDENGVTIIRILPRVVIRTIPDPTPRDVNRMTWAVRKLAGKNSAGIENKQFKGDTLNAYNYLFAIKKDAFPALAKTFMGGKFWGTPVVHPFKLRPTQASMGARIFTDITVSYCFGYRARLSKNPLKESFVTFIPLGVGIGAAKHIREQPGVGPSEEVDNAAITYWQGGVFFTVQKVGFGVFTGLDAMIGHKNDWIYQSKPWFSFGIGYKFKEG